jgi:excisionase family DNA binding protein
MRIVNANTITHNATSQPRPPATGEVMLTLREAAQKLRVSERTLREYVKRGIVPHLRLGRNILFPLRALERWIETHTRGG